MSELAVVHSKYGYSGGCRSLRLCTGNMYNGEVVVKTEADVPAGACGWTSDIWLTSFIEMVGA